MGKWIIWLNDIFSLNHGLSRVYLCVSTLWEHTYSELLMCLWVLVNTCVCRPESMSRWAAHVWGVCLPQDSSQRGAGVSLWRKLRLFPYGGSSLSFQRRANLRRGKKVSKKWGWLKRRCMVASHACFSLQLYILSRMISKPLTLGQVETSVEGHNCREMWKESCS